MIWLNRRSIRNMVIIGAALTLLILFRAQLAAWSAHLVQHPAEVRPLGLIVLLLGSLILIIAARTALPVIYKFRRNTSFWFVRRTLNWWLPLISGIALLVLFLVSAARPTTGPFAGLTTAGVLPLLIPLMTGMQAATLISLEDERTLELPLTYHRPFAWLVAEYALLTLVVHLLIGLLGTFIVLRSDGSEFGEFGALLLRWLPPAVLLWGLGVRSSIATRQIIFSVIAVVTLWYVLLYFGQAVLMQYPYVWLIHPFLPREQLLFILPDAASSGDYLLNRALVTVIGLLLFASALYQLRDEEWVLTGRYPILLRRRLEVDVDVNR